MTEQSNYPCNVEVGDLLGSKHSSKEYRVLEIEERNGEPHFRVETTDNGTTWDKFFDPYLFVLKTKKRITNWRSKIT